MSLRLKVAVVGSVNLDFVIRTKKLPSEGETIGNGKFETLPGGKGANVAVAAKRLGGEVELWGCVGNDLYADAALRVAKAAGVDLSHISRLENQATGVAFINVSEAGENQIAVASGANMIFKPQHIEGVDVDAIITQFEVPDLVILEAIKSNIAFVCVNASPVGTSLEPLLPYTDLVIVNESEYAFYEEALSNFQGLLAITLGENGAILLQAGREVAKASSPKVKIVDTTGAGDSFAAALTIAILEKMTLKDALQFACSAGALTATKIGTQVAVPERYEVEQLMGSHLG